jgi:hypothetical protein
MSEVSVNQILSVIQGLDVKNRNRFSSARSKRLAKKIPKDEAVFQAANVLLQKMRTEAGQQEAIRALEMALESGVTVEPSASTQLHPSAVDVSVEASSQVNQDSLIPAPPVSGLSSTQLHSGAEKSGLSSTQLHSEAEKSGVNVELPASTQLHPSAVDVSVEASSQVNQDSLIPAPLVSGVAVEPPASTQNLEIVMTGTHDGGKILPFRGTATRPVTSEIKPRPSLQLPPLANQTLTPTPTAPLQTSVTTAPVTTAPVVNHSFRVCDPTVLDASKPAWSFGVIEKESAVAQDALGWVAAHANLYTLARALLYCAIIAVSRQPVDDFFQTLNVFGSAPINSLFALAVTITMDLIAMNLFGRAIRSAFGKSHRLELALAFGLPALAIIGANVVLTHRNIETKANVNTNAKAEAEYKAELKIAKEKQERANAEYAAAAGVHFAKRWKGAPDPLACESGTVSCKGPFITGNEKEQAAYSEKQTAKDIADKAVADIEANKPVLSDAGLASGVDQKLWVYLVLWAGILMSYVYEPRKHKLAGTAPTAA